MTLASPHAEPASVGVVSDQRNERRVGALDEPGETAVPHLSRLHRDVFKQAHDRVRKGRAASGGQELADLGDGVALLDGGSAPRAD